MDLGPPSPAVLAPPPWRGVPLPHRTDGASAMHNQDPRPTEEIPESRDQLTESELERIVGARQTKNATETRIQGLNPNMFGSGS